MWLALQQESPDDYVIATGEAHDFPALRKGPIPTFVTASHGIAGQAAE
jgi:GDP-D-mannose dehydratase